jgi:hypothetical protein
VLRVNDTPNSDNNHEDGSADGDGIGSTPLGDYLEHMQLQQVLVQVPLASKHEDGGPMWARRAG